MSSIKLSPNASGTGALTIAAPNTNTDVTFNLGTALGNNGASALVSTDNAGNLGLGVTPSAWSAGRPALEFGGSVQAAIAFNGNNGNGGAITANAFFNGSNWIYKNSVSAAMYQNAGGTHAWFTAPSGTAGNAISFTQAMTLDASGRLGVGTTSPQTLLHVNTSSGVADVFRVTNGTLELNLGVNNGGGGSYVFEATANALRFGTNNTERARIDSSGSLIVGSTVSYGFRLNVESASGSPTALFYRTTSTAADIVLQVTSNVGSGGSTRLLIRASGNVENANNSYGALSDIKLKENITDATPKLEKLNQVRVVNYNLIGEEQKQLGVIAQELEQIFPGMVDESSDRDAEGNDLGTTTKSVKYSVFVPMLIKAIQEQQAIITAQAAALESLTARVAALEGTQA